MSRAASEAQYPAITTARFSMAMSSVAEFDSIPLLIIAIRAASLRRSGSKNVDVTRTALMMLTSNMSAV